MMISRLVFVGSVLLFALGCDQAASVSTTVGGQAKVTLQLNWLAEPQFGGFYAAAANGDYAKNNLDVTVQQGGAGVPTIDMLAAGTVKFAVVSGDEIVVARSRGKKVVALFAVYQKHPQGIMTHATRGFNEISDVFNTEGTLAMEQGLPYSNFLKDKYGFDKIKIVPSPGGDLSVFRNDKNYSMQCFVTSEPLAAKKLGIDAKTFLIADAGYNPYATVLATTEDVLKSDRALAVAVVKSVQAGWNSYLTDPAAGNALMQQSNKTMDAETFIASAEAQKALIEVPAGVGTMTRERWQTLIEQMVALKVIDKLIAIDECYIDPATLLKN